jgi:DNA-binding MarR family transcriptional regulator
MAPVSLPETVADAGAPKPLDVLGDERLTLIGLLAEAFAGIEVRGARQLAEHHLSTVEFEVMIRLARSPEGLLRMSDLSAQTSVTTSGVTRVVDRLQDRGLVDRQACATDRRATYAVVTDRGRALLAEALPGHLELVEALLVAPVRAGGPGALDAFAASLRRVRDRVAPCATAGSDGPDAS